MRRWTYAGPMTTAPNVLSIALDETPDPPLRPLPVRVAELLGELGAPPRLVAHLRAVHDVAAQLVDWVGRRCPAPDVDREAVLFGAAPTENHWLRHTTATYARREPSTLRRFRSATAFPGVPP